MKCDHQNIVRNQKKEICPFCQLDKARIISQCELTTTYMDGFPVSNGHTLIIPRRHISTLFDATKEEQLAILRALNVAKETLDRTCTPDGFNIGFNHGKAGGQTVAHLHIHIIPRYLGDSKDPRGGIRWVLPDKAKYWDE